MALLGVDVGGTFTDAVVVHGGTVTTAKVPTTPHDQSHGVLQAVSSCLQKAHLEPQRIERFAHGMTVTTNALLEGKTARTGLLVTEGFTDIVELGRQNRADLYRLCRSGPAPLVPTDLRFPIRERTTPEGVLTPLDELHTKQMTAQIAAAKLESVAVVLLHSYRHPEHELRLEEILRKELPGLHISLSHRTVGVFREYERAATTEIDASLAPLLTRYLKRLADRADRQGLPTVEIMQSNGGLVDIETVSQRAATTVLSGPAGGARGAAIAAAAAGHENALCLDMGGTSCDVSVIEQGSVREVYSRAVAQRPIALPALDIHTVGAGGGSVAWCDSGGALRVGPHSAGAEPGPACYNRGGKQPTVTDANLMLGYLQDGSELAGGVRLNGAAAEQAIGELSTQLALTPMECAAGIVRVANTAMANALRAVTVARGIDPREYALVAFGGAGPLHAAEIATELEIEKVICPYTSGVLSALGLASSPRRYDLQRSVMLSEQEIDRRSTSKLVQQLAAEALAGIGDSSAQLLYRYDIRYRGQSFELTVSGNDQPNSTGLRAAFGQVHQQRYGYREEHYEIELVTVHVAAQVSGPSVVLNAPTATATRSRRAAIFSGQELSTEVLSGNPTTDTQLVGPAIWELPETTLVVPPGWSSQATQHGSIVLKKEGTSSE